RSEVYNKGAYGLAYTSIWLGGWRNDPETFDNLFNVRGSRGTQRETKAVIVLMEKMIRENL
ncbi:MAG: hypothetical protein U9Q66_04025, partial [Patescibacteria group bacterium]|nr:hypothetical protein [Patescibacteria group bacterium]